MTPRPNAPRATRALVLSCAVVACGAPRDRVPAGTPASPSARAFATDALDTLWRKSAGPTLPFGNPEFLAADSANVYVGDTGREAVLALDASTGRLRWQTTPNGDSAAIVAPRALAPRRSGGLLAFDAARRTIVAFRPDGSVDWRTPLPAVEMAQSLCELPDASLLVVVMGSAGGIVRVDSRGAAGGAYPLPWPDMARRPGLLAATLLAPARDGCVAALMLGRGFARFDGTTFSAPTAYVEPFDLPALVTTRTRTADSYTESNSLAEHVIAAQDIAMTSNALVVAFGGRSADQAHLLDAYGFDGAYRTSYRTASRVNAIAAAGSTLYVLTHRRGVPTVVALHWPASARTAQR